MPDIQFQTLECTNPDCRFRFPVELPYSHETCPRCGEKVNPVGEHYLPLDQLPGAINGIGLECHALLDNLRSIHNVGSIFRTADGLGVGRLYLCGMTPTPDNPRLVKAALGAEKNMAWTYHTNAVEIARNLKQAGAKLWGIEGGAHAESIYNAPMIGETKTVILVIGNERSGVEPGLLALCDRVLSIPMRGRKRSLNAAVAFGVALGVLGEVRIR